MTYLVPRVIRRYRRRSPALSGIWDAVTGAMAGQSQESQCIDQANTATAPFDARIDDLAKNWNPTGFYTSADMRTIIGAALSTVQKGQAAIDQAAAEPNASQDSVMRATDDLARAGQRSLTYIQAANAADQQGLATLNAPGLKRWVLDTMAAASSALVTAMTIGCLRPWWVDALSAFQAAFDTAWAIVKRVVGAVLAIGETALKVAEDLPEIYDVLKWVAVAGVAYWLWREIGHTTSGHSIL
jgi:hypothetical protein